MSGIAAVQARISDIQSRLAQVTAAVTPAATAAPATTAASGAQFSTLLEDLVRTGGTATAPKTTASAAASAAAPAATGRPRTDGPTGEDLVTAARQYLGVPYKWGGTDPATGGLDCSGLVQRAMKDIGVDVPRVAKDQAKVGEPVRDLASARPGDLVVMDGGSHIGIYVGDGKMLHAPHRGDVVKISKVWETPTSIRRVVGTEAAPAATGAAPTAALDAGAARPSAIRSSVSAAVARFEPLFAAATEKHGLPAGLLAAVAQAESGGDARAVSPAGAQGLMQIMPGTARDLGVDPMDPAQAVDGAARLLARHLKSYDGSVPLSLAAYNAGPGNVARYDGIPPFEETRNYVRKITSALGIAA